MVRFNEVMAYVMELESDGIVRYNFETGSYETDLRL
jgi:hypothetical protein